MGTFKLTTYLNQIEAKYVLAREEWEKVQKKIAEQDKAYSEIRWSDYTHEGRVNVNADYKEKRKAECKKLEEIRQKFIKETESILTTSESVFRSLYRYAPEKVDEKGVMILQNGNLKPHELIELAETYRKNGNYTMYYLVAERLKPDNKEHYNRTEEEKGAYAYYTKAKQRREDREDCQILEGFRDGCLYALRDDGLLSNGIANIHEELYMNNLKAAEEIEINQESPWD